MFASQRILKCVLRPIARSCRQMCSDTEEIPTKVIQNLEKSINKITLLGRVGIDPQLRGNDSTPVVVFTVATNNNYRFESGEIQQKTEWHRVSVFKPFLRNSVALNIKKGYRVYVDGRLVYGEIVDAKGNCQLTSTVVANDVICLTKTPESQSDASN